MGRTSTPDLFASIASAQRRVVARHVSSNTWSVGGNNVKHCSSVPPDVDDYFQQAMSIHDIDSDDEQLRRALHASREEEQFVRAARELAGGGRGGGKT
jgi:hypothetical protein